jgi:DNA end-binding protein Ku
LERFLSPAQFDPLLYAGRSLYLVPDGVVAEPGYTVLRAALVQRQRWALGRMVLGGHRQVVLVRPAGSALVAQVLHYPEQVRSCPWVAQPAPDATRPDSPDQLVGHDTDAAEWHVILDLADTVVVQETGDEDSRAVGGSLG